MKIWQTQHQVYSKLRTFGRNCWCSEKSASLDVSWQALGCGRTFCWDVTDDNWQDALKSMDLFVCLWQDITILTCGPPYWICWLKMVSNWSSFMCSLSVLCQQGSCSQGNYRWVKQSMFSHSSRTTTLHNHHCDWTKENNENYKTQTSCERISSISVGSLVFQIDPQQGSPLSEATLAERLRNAGYRLVHTAPWRPSLPSNVFLSLWLKCLYFWCF